MNFDKIAPRRGENTIFKVFKGLEKVLFSYFPGYTFMIASELYFLSFSSEFKLHLGWKCSKLEPRGDPETTPGLSLWRPMSMS